MNEGQLFTAATWAVRQGNEEEFVEAWRTFARWTSEQQPGAGAGHLLRDAQDSRVFLSFGPWGDIEQIRSWRASPEFGAFFAKAQSLCESIEPRVLRLVALAPPRR